MVSRDTASGWARLARFLPREFPREFFHRRRRALRHRPGSLVVAGFGLMVLAGTLLLLLPIATESGESTSPMTALFTATSAVCVTGLIVVDTPEYWSSFGEIVILGLIKLGGLGIMTVASLLSLAIADRLGLRMQLSAQAETKSTGLGNIRAIGTRIVLIGLSFEATVALILSARLMIGYDESPGRAVYLGVFHAISAFNNAGFSLYSDNLMGFTTDPWVIVPIMVAIIGGGIGFPVLFEVGRRLRGAHRWTLHAKVTILAYCTLLVGGSIAITATEWANPATFGPLDTGGKLLAGVFQSVSARTAGFNSVDFADLHTQTLLINDVLMFIGGGSAGTAGGIKVTTFALLAFVIFAEIRGTPTVHVMGRRLGGSLQRQAVTIALLGVALVVTTTLALQVMTPFTLDQVLFEVVSAFGTVGLSTGITADLPTVGQVLIAVVMFIGRLGPITLASALALRERGRRYELPEERPIVG